jgi:hypothetical protein
MKPLRFLAFAAALALAACTSSPTDTSSVAPAGPSFDEGPGMVGGGNNTAADGTNLIGSGTLSTENGGGSLGSGNNTASSDTTTRGGGSLGSGN